MEGVPSALVSAVDINSSLNQKPNYANDVNILVIFAQAMESIPSVFGCAFDVDLIVYQKLNYVNQIFFCVIST
jgi:hypothetical protein